MGTHSPAAVAPLEHPRCARERGYLPFQPYLHVPEVFCLHLAALVHYTELS